MSKTSINVKVGLFVAGCLVVVALLLLQFSKGTTFFRPTYTVVLKTKNVGSLKTRASVLISGVQVGSISKIELTPDSRAVLIGLRIYGEHKIFPDARFVIEQSGFLGDQYVAIYPTANEGQPLRDGASADAKEPFNLQEAAQSAKGFIDGVNATAKKLDAAVDDIRRQFLNEHTLSNLSVAVSNVRQVSEDAKATVNDLHVLVSSNQVSVAAAVSNLLVFSQQLDRAGDSAQGILSNSAPQLSAIFSNFQASTESLTNLLGDVRAGRGVVGGLFGDSQLATNFSVTISNLSVTSSNLNQLGLWRLFFPKHPAQPARPETTTTPPPAASTTRKGRE